MIPFNKPCYTGNEKQFVLESMIASQMCGDGKFTKKCHDWFENFLNCKKALLTTSCTHALEMTALMLDIKEGDEIIMPSFTFVSSANAFVLRGAKIVFVDIRPDTMNIDETLIEQAITEKTKAIMPVHYAAVACEMDTIMSIAEKYNLTVIEDAAQAMTSTYKSKQVGTLGHMAAFSFHDTKNFTSGGEGGLLIINDNRFIQQAEIIREKGTNRSLFKLGLVDKYSWVDVGSSYLMNELSAAYLWGQLENVEKISRKRTNLFDLYVKLLKPLEDNHLISLPIIPEGCQHNSHIFYFKVINLSVRNKLIKYLKSKEIQTTFHYVPLHSSQAGKKFSVFIGEDNYTTIESNRLIRLPMYFDLKESELETVVENIFNFFNQKM